MKNPERLHDLETFAHFSAPQLARLSECLKTVSCSAGSALFREGDESDSFFLLDEGNVTIRKMTAFGPFDLESPTPGELFAEIGFLDGSAREGDAEALADSEIVVFDAISLREQSNQDPRFDLALQWALWKSLSAKLRATNNRLGRFFATDGDTPAITATAPNGASPDDKLDLAHKIGIFREQKLSTMEINFLASLSREERFAPGDVIFREGDPGEKMYVVAEGTVMISKMIPGVGEEALAFLERGDYFGEMALIEDRPRSADARAHPDFGAAVLSLPREVVGGLLNVEKLSSARLLRILSRVAAKRVRELHEKLVGLYVLAGGDLESALT